MDKPQAKANEAEADAKIEYQDQIAALRERRDTAEKKLGQMQNASDAAWQDVKSGVDKAMDDLTNAFNNAAARFRPAAPAPGTS